MRHLHRLDFGFTKQEHGGKCKKVKIKYMSKHKKSNTMSKAQSTPKKTTATTLAVAPSLILTVTDTPDGHLCHVDFNGNDVRLLQLQRKFTFPDGTVGTVTWTNDTGGSTQSGPWLMATGGRLEPAGATSDDELVDNCRPFGPDTGIIPGTYEYFADASLNSGGIAYSNHVVLVEA